MAARPFILIFSVIVAQIETGQWISPSEPLLPRKDGAMAVGNYKDVITLIGGDEYGRDVTEYNISNDSFTYYANTLPVNVSAQAQIWTQMDDAMYLALDSQIHRYDLITKEFTSDWSNAGIPEDIKNFACIASSNNVLYVVGGNNNLLQIYNISSRNWSEGPNMNVPRREHGCVISPETSTLYAIAGGSTIPQEVDYNTVEYISINDLISWQYTNNNLSEASGGAMAVAYDTYVYVIGGFSHDGLVYIIDVFTNTISISDKLVYNVHYSAPIAVEQILYVFGGSLDPKKPKNWQYYHLEPTANPTTSPTTSEPTKEPTAIPTIDEAAASERTTTRTPGNGPDPAKSTGSNQIFEIIIVVAIILFVLVCCAAIMVIRKCVLMKRGDGNKDDRSAQMIAFANKKVEREPKHQHRELRKQTTIEHSGEGGEPPEADPEMERDEFIVDGDETGMTSGQFVVDGQVDGVETRGNEQGHVRIMSNSQIKDDEEVIGDEEYETMGMKDNMDDVKNDEEVIADAEYETMGLKNNMDDRKDEEVNDMMTIGDRVLDENGAPEFNDVILDAANTNGDIN